MGKVDDMRAMREARFSERAKRVMSKAEEKRASKVETPAPPTEELCGHKAIGGKSCTRPKDHTEKNHRYK